MNKHNYSDILRTIRKYVEVPDDRYVLPCHKTKHNAHSAVLLCYIYNVYPNKVSFYKSGSIELIIDSNNYHVCIELDDINFTYLIVDNRTNDSSKAIGEDNVSIDQLNVYLKKIRDTIL